MIHRCLLAMTAILVAMVGSALAQVLRQMEVAEVPEGESVPYIVRDADEAILVVHSTIRQMQFESTNPILQVDDDGGGEYILHLRPGTNVIKFKADGFVSVQERYVIGAKKYKEVNVRPTGLRGEQAALGWIEFELESGPVVVVQDGTQIGEFNVGASGVFTMALPPGPHMIRLIRFGSDHYAAEIDVEVGRTVRNVVEFATGDSSEQMTASATGVLVVKSNPTKATVHVDGVLVGSTPNQVREIAVGNHQVRIEKLMHEPLVKQVEIKPDVVTTIDELLKPDFGRLTLDSDPPGVDVSLDGKYVGKTPYSADMISTGAHSIVLEKTTFHDVIWSLNVESGAQIDTTIKMPPAYGKLTVTTLPHGAKVFLDNVEIGVTPLTRDTLPSGEYVLRIEEELHGTLERTLSIADNSEMLVDTPLDRDFGTVMVTSDPVGIAVRLSESGRTLGTTPLRSHLSSGMYTVLLEDDKYEGYSEIIQVGVGDSVRVDAGNMARKTGTLKVFTEPLDADVFVDGVYAGKSPLIIKNAPTGPRNIVARLADYSDALKQVVIEYGETSQADLVLSKSGVTNVAFFLEEFRPFLESADLTFDLDSDADVAITMYDERNLALFSQTMRGARGKNTCSFGGRCSISCTGSFGFIPEGIYTLNIQKTGDSTSYVTPLEITIDAPTGLVLTDNLTAIPGKSLLSEEEVSFGGRAKSWGLACLGVGLGTVLWGACFFPGEGWDADREMNQIGVIGSGVGLVVIGGVLTVIGVPKAGHNQRLAKELESSNAEINSQNMLIKNETVMRLALGQQQ